MERREGAKKILSDRLSGASGSRCIERKIQRDTEKDIDFEVVFWLLGVYEHVIKSVQYKF
jgi:hypothetical protein